MLFAEIDWSHPGTIATVIGAVVAGVVTIAGSILTPLGAAGAFVLNYLAKQREADRELSRVLGAKLELAVTVIGGAVEKGADRTVGKITEQTAAFSDRLKDQTASITQGLDDVKTAVQCKFVVDKK